MRRSETMHKVVDEDLGKDMDKWSIDLDGAVAEYCVAKALNVCPDLDTSIKVGGIDLTTRKGKTVDVKSTRRLNGKLLAKLRKLNDPCDIYVLVIVDDFGGDIVGWTSKDKMFAEENKKDLGYGITYALEQSQLYPFKPSI